MSVENMTILDRGEVEGIEWVTAQAPIYGAVNGYVRVPEGHPWAGLDYDQIYDDYGISWTAELVAVEAQNLARQVAAVGATPEGQKDA